MSTDNSSFLSNIFMLKGKTFYDLLETTFSTELKELARLQGFSSARSILHSKQSFLDFLLIDSADPNLIHLKNLAAFRESNGTWKIKVGIQYDIDCLMSYLHQAEHEEAMTASADSILVSTTVLSYFPWLRSLIMFCQNSMIVKDRDDLTFLSLFIENMANNLTKSSCHNRYSHVVQEFAFALYVFGGRQAYEFVRINLPGTLPSISTLSKLFNENKEQLKEGEFRFDSMENHLKSMNVRYAFASEDCTGVIQKVSYDRQLNSFIGFTLPLNNNGFPQTSAFRIETFSDLEATFKNETLSSLLNVHAIQPITRQGQNSSPFFISAYGTDNRFDSYHLINRWLKIFDESLQRGVRIIGFSTDCDPRYLRAMRLTTNFFASLPNFDFRQRSDVFKVNLPTEWNWFYLDPTQLFLVFQDPIHLATKIRNRMLSSTTTLLMGNQLVSIDVLRQILSSSSSKLFHGLMSSDLNPRDHQNFASCYRISRDTVFQALEHIHHSNATTIYIKILRSVIDAYIEKSTSVLDRVLHAWTSVFLSRFWLLWIEKMGKKKLDNLLVELTKNCNEYSYSTRRSVQQYFLTSQAVYSIELNAHSLVYLILLVIEGKLPEDVLTVDRFHSQSCEAIFRSARALSSKSSSGVNFTTAQFLNLTEKLSLLQKIKHQHEQTTSPILHFPTHHKNKHSYLSSNQNVCINIPTHAEIEQTVVRAFHKATYYLEQVGIMNDLRKHKLHGMINLNDHARALFENQGILDHFSQDISDDTDDDSEVYESEGDEENDDESDMDAIRYHSNLDSSQLTFRTVRVCDQAPPHLLPSYFKVRINDNDKFLHKSTACWILTEENPKLSADRTRRVTQAK